MRLVFILVLMLGVFTGNAKDRWKEIKTVRLVRIDDRVQMLNLMPFCSSFDTDSLRQYNDTVEIKDVELQKDLVNRILRSTREKNQGGNMRTDAKMYIEYTSGQIDVVCFLVYGTLSLNGEVRTLENKLYDLIYYQIPRGKQPRVQAHAGSELHECMFDTLTAKKCGEDSLYHVYYSPLFVNLPGVHSDSVSIQADFVKITKRPIGRYAIKEIGRRDSVRFRVYRSGILVDSFVKYFSKVNLPPRFDLCRASHGPCIHPFLNQIYTRTPFGYAEESLSFEVLGIVADLYENNKLVYSEYMGGNYFSDAFKARYDKLTRQYENKIALRTIIFKDSEGNISIGSGEIHMNYPNADKQ